MRPRRHHILAATLLAVMTSACWSSSEGQPYQLYTHCGLEETSIEFDGDHWRAVGPEPLADGFGNPPSGFGDPTDLGRIWRTGPDTAVFVSSQGVRLDLERAAGPPERFICF